MNTADQQSTVTAPMVKVASAWAMVGFTSWADAAAFAAFLYSVLLIGEWLWKKLGRPFAESRGWVKRKSRRRDDWQG